MIKLPARFRDYLSLDVIEFLALLCLIPFFQPACIDSFVLYGIKVSLFSLIGKCFTAMRLAISCSAILLFCLKINEIKRKMNFTMFSILLSIILLVAVSGIVNSARVTVLLSYVYDIGLLCLFELMILHGRNSFLKIITKLFGALSFLGAASIIAFPHGFNHAYDVHNAIYFLGSKNAAINVYIIFFMALWGEALHDGTRMPKRSVFYLVIFMLTGVIMGSGSTMVCVLGMACIYVNFGSLHGKITIAPIVPFAVIVVAIVAVYVGSMSPLILHLLEMMGRDTTFSGRTILWRQALRYYNNNVMFGAGIDIVYHNFSGIVQYSAHSQFLDRLAKYGLIPFIPFVASFVYMEKQLMFTKLKKMSSMLGLFIALYLLRMGFDVYSLYYIFTIAYLCNLFTRKEDDDLSSLLSIFGIKLER